MFRRNSSFQPPTSSHESAQAAQALQYSMLLGAAKHEVRGGLAGLDAISHKREVFLFNMLAAHFKAVLIKHGFALVATLVTIFNTFLNLHVIVVHSIFPLKIIILGYFANKQ
jgi:hypothetical protein